MEYRHQNIFFACYIYLTFCGGLNSQEIYDVQRLIDNENDITEPYVPRNYFANPSHTGFFMYCTNRDAACSGFFSCHQCKCNSGTTFYSINDGCLSRDSIKYETKEKGLDICYTFLSMINIRLYLTFLRSISRLFRHFQ